MSSLTWTAEFNISDSPPWEHGHTVGQGCSPGPKEADTLSLSSIITHQLGLSTLSLKELNIQTSNFDSEP